MYKLFLDLTTFLTACRQIGTILNVQSVQKAAQHTLPTVESSLMLTATVPHPRPGEPQILVARVVIEETQLWSDAGAARTALTDRTQTADTLLRAACTAAGVAVAPHDGILAEAGVMEDLWQISTTQKLWRIARLDPTNSAAWTLHPAPPTATATNTPAPAPTGVLPTDRKDPP